MTGTHVRALASGGAALAVLTAAGVAEAQIQPGSDAPMFVTVDENLNTVDMRDLTDGRPLVLAIGSAS